MKTIRITGQCWQITDTIWGRSLTIMFVLGHCQEIDVGPIKTVMTYGRTNTFYCNIEKTRKYGRGGVGVLVLISHFPIRKKLDE